VELAGVAGTMVSGGVSDRLGRRTVLLAAMATAPVLLLIFLVVGGWMVFPVLFLLGFTVFAPAPVMLAIVQDHAHGMRAAANGIYMGINFLVMSGVTLLVGWMGDLWGLKITFAWLALLALLGIPAIYFLPVQRHSDQKLPAREK
jgi:MFS family permease